MKKLKLVTAIIAIFLISNLLFAGNPENIAVKMIEKLSNDVILTDSQRVVIQTKADEYVLKMQNVNLITNIEEQFALRKQISKEYDASLDSLLTIEQREQLMIKIKERKDAN